MKFRGECYIAVARYVINIFVVTHPSFTQPTVSPL